MADPNEVERLVLWAGWTIVCDGAKALAPWSRRRAAVICDTFILLLQIVLDVCIFLLSIALMNIVSDYPKTTISVILIDLPLLIRTI